jgi:3-deoxy-D-manno-octulosonic-acid transferase
LLFLYNIGIRLYVLAIKLSSFWNKKAKSWLDGRKSWEQELKKSINSNLPLIWVHCASAGEFEQGKPVIEALKREYPDHQVLVSFFSPSGYEMGKKYTGADVITYLPIDSHKNAKRFISIIQPQVAIFVKYDFWYHYFQTLAFNHVPLLIIAAVFRQKQVFFQWWGRFFRKMLLLPRHIFVQDEASLQLLLQYGIKQASISGDTRFDRVVQVVESFSAIDVIESFVSTDPLLVAGSTWPEDESMLQIVSGMKMIIAPHEVNEDHLIKIEKLFPDSVRFSQFSRNKKVSRVLIIDNIGMLSRLYHYATITYVGGGFTRDGIHNILEAAVWGKPVLFGPNYKKYREAKELIDCGGAKSFSNKNDLKTFLDELQKTPQTIAAMGSCSKNYISQKTGATKKILQMVQEKRLLTN